MWQTICGVVIRSVRNEKGSGGSSPGCISSPAQSIVPPSSRGGVPVLSRPERETRSGASVRDSPSDGASPTRPAGIFSSPVWMRPPRNVPVVSTTRPAASRRPSPSTSPATRPRRVEQQILGRALDDREAVDVGRATRHRAAIELAVGLGARARAPPGPLLRLSMRNWMPARSIARPMTPVERVDLAHEMALGEPADRRVARHLADRGAAMRQERVRAPSRAAAAAASQPACPPPITTTS